MYGFSGRIIFIRKKKTQYREVFLRDFGIKHEILTVFY